MFLFWWQTLENEIISHTRRPWWRLVWRRQCSTKTNSWNMIGIGNGGVYCLTSMSGILIYILITGDRNAFVKCSTIYLLSIWHPVSGERRSWMMSPITLPLSQISGCLLVRGRSCGKRRRSLESFAMPLAKTGRSRWILPADKWLTRETTSTSTTESEIQWRHLGPGKIYVT